MIIVKLNKADFEYDIHSLIKAFFPKEDVRVTAVNKIFSGMISLFLEIEYDNSEIKFVLYQPDLELEYTEQMWEQLPAENAAFREEFMIKTEGDDRSERKNKLKQGLYRLLKKNTKQELPWGTLTGIRPVKIPMAFLAQGKSEDDICRYMKDTYFVSDEKIDLSMEIAKKELELLSAIDYCDGYSLYIGIPFCPTTCLYCSFTSYPAKTWEQKMESYIEAVEREIDFTSVNLRHLKLNTIYIGGGTPTTLNPMLMERLLTKIERSFDFSNLIEYTVEAGRPDSITQDKLAVLKKHGITRISINPQTMNQKTLDLIGRKHTISQTEESYHLARKLGFDNINMDLIVGLPGETYEDVLHTLDEIKRLAPDSLTVHSLAVKRASALRNYKEEHPDTGMVNTQAMIEAAAKAAKEMDMFPYYLYRQKNMAGNYENVGYSKQDKSGLYNILIMEEKQSIIAIGAGAITKYVVDGGNTIERSENVKDISNYLERIDEMVERKRSCFEKFIESEKK